MNPYTPEEDSEEIWGDAYLSGRAKYKIGQEEHGGGFWTGGASWYAESLREEVLDSVAYLHHLRRRLASIRSLARLMREDDAMTLPMAATILEHLAGSHAPKPITTKHHD